MPDEILDINTGEPVIAIARKEWTNCSCRKIWVDRHERKVTCRDCGRMIEPIDWLVSFAHAEGSLIQRLKYLEDETKERSERVETLKGEEQKIKARIRDAKAKLLGTMGI